MVRIMWVVAVAVSLVACVEDAETGADASTSDLDAAVTDGATHDGTMGDIGGGETPDGETPDGPTGDGPVDNPLPISADVAAEHCEQACTDFDADCDLTPVGGDEAACREACEARAAEDGFWVGAYECFSSSCDAGCLDGPATPTDLCDQACERLDGCGALGIFEIADGETNVCRALCAGAVEGEPGIDGLVECVSEGFADGCGGTFSCPGDCPPNMPCEAGYCGGPPAPCAAGDCPAFPGACW